MVDKILVKYFFINYLNKIKCYVLMKLIFRKNNYSGMCNIGFYEIDLRINDYVKYSFFVVLCVLF